MRSSLLVGSILASMTAAGCSGRGTEGGRCFPNDTCNAGLVCASGRCVLLPGPDSSVDGGADAAATDAAESGAADGGDASAGCGNGVVDGIERCDGPDLGGSSCTGLGLGFIGGVLTCTATCVFDVSGCTVPPGCGDGVVDPGEDCDGAALDGGSCATFGFASGAVTCAPGCVLLADECFTCGDGLRQPVEACDGTATGGATCTSLGFAGGTLSCATDCFSLDPSTCTGGPPTVPVLRKPMNNSYLGSIFVAGSRSPAFTWEPSTVTGGATIDYEVNYSTSATFSSGVSAAMVSAATYQPPSDLVVSMAAPVGSRWYWRVRACSSGACSAWSGTWWVNVGRSDRDFDGDGFGDVVVGDPQVGGVVGEVRAFRGGSGPSFDATPDLILGAPSGASSFGQAVASGADVNADGFTDLVVGAYGQAFVYLGGTGFFTDSIADGVLVGTGGFDHFGWAVGSAGDVDGDGYDDLVIGARFDDMTGADAGRVYVFLGGAGSAFDVTADVTFEGTSAGDELGNPVAGGDLNGDGYADVAAGAFLADGAGLGSGLVAVFFGGPLGGPDVSADGVAAGSAASEYFGTGIAIGDVNADGFGDLVVGAQGAMSFMGRADVFLGGPGPTLDVLADATIIGPVPSGGAGRGVAVLGDVNGDAVGDFAVGVPTAGSGSVRLYFGVAGPVPDTTSDATLLGASMGSEFGLALAGAGDVNGDGFLDLVAGAWNAGSAYVYLGASGPFDPVADGSLFGVGPFAFGISVY